ncbi:GTP-binding protein [Tumidithrix elongata]|uniref:GTP-binding protein n=1 Tax=Tumidithrix elongata TaxID=3088357 RepID=UPI0038CD34AD
MEIMRLVVTGTVGAGKSTFIRSASEIDVVDTDRVATDETALLKKKTTVAMDFGRLSFGPNMALHLYGTPGQTRFDFMWDILIKKAHAYILLVAANRPSEFRYARRILTFMNRRVKIPLIIGLTHMDCEGAWTSENIAIALGFVNPQSQPPIIAVNANERDSVVRALIALMQHYIEQAGAA